MTHDEWETDRQWKYLGELAADCDFRAPREHESPDEYRDALAVSGALLTRPAASTTVQ